jgi:hypothetical protein
MTSTADIVPISKYIVQIAYWVLLSDVRSRTRGHHHDNSLDLKTADSTDCVRRLLFSHGVEGCHKRTKGTLGPPLRLGIARGNDAAPDERNVRCFLVCVVVEYMERKGSEDDKICLRQKMEAARPSSHITTPLDRDLHLHHHETHILQV